VLLTAGDIEMNGNISKFGTTIVALTALAVLTTATPAMAAKPVGGSRPTSAVVAVLEFDGDWTSDTLSHIPIVPTVCQTGEHLAGPSEVAIATMNGFVAPSGAHAASAKATMAAVAPSGSHRDGPPVRMLVSHSTCVPPRPGLFHSVALISSWLAPAGCVEAANHSATRRIVWTTIESERGRRTGTCPIGVAGR